MKFKPGLKGSEPLRTFAEMCDEFGVPMSLLRVAFRDSTIPPPKPVQQYRATTGGMPQRTYYRPSEMRRWWKAHNESKQCNSIKPI